MTPQEAAVRLREWYIAFDRYGKGNDPAVKEILEAADVLESTAADIDTLREFTKELAARNEELHKEKLAAVLRVPRWISVHDALPGMDEKVLFIPACNPGSVYIGKLKYVGEVNAVYFVVNNWRRTVTYSATHWMPLPEPPEEDEAE